MHRKRKSIVKLGTSKQPKFHPIPFTVKAYIPLSPQSIILRDLLRPYSFTTYKFIEFKSHHLPGQDLKELQLACHKHISHTHSLLYFRACEEPYCPIHR